MTTESPIEKDTPAVKMEENKVAPKKVKSAKLAPVAKKSIPAAKKTESKVAAKKIKNAKPAPVAKQLAAPATKAAETRAAAPKAAAPKAAETKVAPKKEKKTKEASVKSEKKILREAIELSIENTFPNIKKAVGEKKFNKQVKKASKVLVKGAAKTKK